MFNFTAIATSTESREFSDHARQINSRESPISPAVACQCRGKLDAGKCSSTYSNGLLEETCGRHSRFSIRSALALVPRKEIALIGLVQRAFTAIDDDFEVMDKGMEGTGYKDHSFVVNFEVWSSLMRYLRQLLNGQYPSAAFHSESDERGRSLTGAFQIVIWNMTNDAVHKALAEPPKSTTNNATAQPINPQEAFLKRLNLTTVFHLFDNVAKGLTLGMRLSELHDFRVNHFFGNRTFPEETGGAVFVRRTVVHIHWPWIVVPVILQILVALLLYIIFWRSCMAELPYWIDSSRAMIFHGLEEESFPALHTMISEEEMRNLSNNVLIQVVAGERSIRLKRKDCPPS